VNSHRDSYTGGGGTLSTGGSLKVGRGNTNVEFNCTGGKGRGTPFDGYARRAEVTGHPGVLRLTVRITQGPD
jgi:hypothetical protein